MARVALVTGGTRGIGHAISIALKNAGYRVAASYAGNDAAAQAFQVETGIPVYKFDVASYEASEKAVKQIEKDLGPVDVLVNNAGIIRDRSFARMTEEDWQAVLDVHLTGAWRTTQAAWKHMLQRQYGRILFTSSAAGLYGNFGQANYGAAKLGLVGLMRTLAREGAAKNICSNAIAPLATTPATQAVMPGELAGKLNPGQVVALVVLLAHESSAENGALFEAGGGWFACLRWERSQGVHFAPDQALDAETLAARWADVVDFSAGSEHPQSVADTLRRAAGALP